jgi:hypothetical protein
MAFEPLLQVVTLCSSGLGKLLMKRDHYFNNHNHYLPHAIHPGRASPVSVALSLLSLQRPRRRLRSSSSAACQTLLASRSSSVSRFRLYLNRLLQKKPYSAYIIPHRPDRSDGGCRTHDPIVRALTLPAAGAHRC